MAELPRRTIILVATALLVLIAACSDDDPVAPQPVMISEVGVLLGSTTYSDGTLSTYRFEKVLFEGDMLIAEYRSAKDQGPALFRENEHIVMVRNFQAYPPSLVEGLTHLSDFSVLTGMEELYEDCTGGWVYRGNVIDGVVEVEPTEMIWLP